MELRVQLLLAAAKLLSLFVLRSVCSQAAAPCFPPDRLALREVAFAFLRNSKPTTAFVGWEGDECCAWHGVVCKSSNHTPTPAAAAAARVSKLRLVHKNLKGAIPSAICSLSALSTLDLSDNFLTGSIPSCLPLNLSNLRHLHLSLNILNGTIPTSFSGLLQLRSFSLASNAYNPLDYYDVGGLWGSVLPVSALPQLAYLDLSGNYFNSIPPFQTPRLQWLLLNTSFGGSSSIPVFTNGTPNLQYLDLSDNPIFTSGFTNLVTYPLLQLQHLDLSNCDFLSGKIPAREIISQLPQLRTLMLDFTLLAADGPQISELLCGLKSLEMFSMSGNNDYGKESLYPLQVSVHNLAGEMPDPSSCKSPSLNLTSLDLSYNKLRGPFPAWISLFSNLQELSLCGNNFSSSAIPPEWQNLTKLTLLQLSGPTSSSDLHPKPTSTNFLLPRHMQNWLFRLPLQILTLSSLGLANQHIPCSQLSLVNATLQYLDFSNNLLTDGHALQCLAHNNFTTLEYLDLSQNALAFNLGLSIPPSLSMKLNLASCQLQGELTDQFFEMFHPGDIELYVGLYISLGHNYFSGSLPSGIGVLANTRYLDLSYNDFTGPIPRSVGNITGLRFLLLENNHLEGEVPQELGTMNFLHTVFLGNNKLTKWLPLYNLSTDLQILDLSSNRLEGDLEHTFFGHDHSVLSSLIVLLLGHNQLSGAIPAALNGTTARFLSVIQLSENHLTGTIPHTLFKLFPSLTLEKHYISNELVERAFTLVVKNLVLSYDYANQRDIFAYLDLSKNTLNGSIPESLGALSRLRYLNLSRNQLTGSIPSSLANLSLLESLDLSYNRLQGSLPRSLSGLTKLGVFNVSFNEELSGPIPMNSPQFEIASSYIGDPKMCGDLYLHRCSDTNPHDDEKDHKIDQSQSFFMKWIDEWIAIPGLCLGIVVGFFGALWVLKVTRFV